MEPIRVLKLEPLEPWLKSFPGPLETCDFELTLLETLHFESLLLEVYSWNLSWNLKLFWHIHQPPLSCLPSFGAFTWTFFCNLHQEPCAKPYFHRNLCGRTSNFQLEPSTETSCWNLFIGAFFDWKEVLWNLCNLFLELYVESFPETFPGKSIEPTWHRPKLAAVGEKLKGLCVLCQESNLSFLISVAVSCSSRKKWVRWCKKLMRSIFWDCWEVSHLPFKTSDELPPGIKQQGRPVSSNKDDQSQRPPRRERWKPFALKHKASKKGPTVNSPRRRRSGNSYCA